MINQIGALAILLATLTAKAFGLSPSARARKCVNSNNPIQRIPRASPSCLPYSRRDIAVDIVDVAADDEPCLAGDNVVLSCDTPPQTPPAYQGTQTRLSAATNLGKCICGAGSFALPHVFLKEGVVGGTLAMTACAFLAACTMQSINRSRYLAAEYDDATETSAPPASSYVDLTNLALGRGASRLVFALTMAASLGVCSTYIVFIGQTLASLSADATSGNVVHVAAPDVDETAWEAMTAATVFPLSLVRNYGVFAFTSALGVAAVLGGIIVTLAYGVLVDPGGGIAVALSAVEGLKMWPENVSDAFGGSFGTIAYLFCVNFLTFPIMNSMKDARNEYEGAVSSAVSVIWIVNVLFAIICLGFYGDQTQDLVLGNLDNGPYLSTLKLLLCVDLLFTFPVVFSSGRQILENLFIDDELLQSEDDAENMSLTAMRTAITGGAVATCFCLSQLGGFGVVGKFLSGVFKCIRKPLFTLLTIKLLFTVLSPLQPTW